MDMPLRSNSHRPIGGFAPPVAERHLYCKIYELEGMNQLRVNKRVSGSFLPG